MASTQELEAELARLRAENERLTAEHSVRADSAAAAMNSSLHRMAQRGNAEMAAYRQMQSGADVNLGDPIPSARDAALGVLQDMGLA